MRPASLTWLAVLALGAALAQTPNAGQPATNSSTRITIKNFSFDPATLDVPVGTEVEWTDEVGRHTVKADNGSFNSGTLMPGGTFKHRFDRAGVYRYYCELHGSKGGHDMAGVINVRK